MYDFAKEMYFDVEATGNKSNPDRTLIKLLKSPSIRLSASGVSKTIFFSSVPNELCDRLKLLLQEKQAGKKPGLYDGEIVAIADKFLKYKSITTN